MPNQTIEHEVNEQQEGRVDLVVRDHVPISRSKLKRLFDNNCVTLNQKPCPDPGAHVKKGDKVVITYDPHQGYAAKKRPWSDRTFAIVHEDKQLLVINKSAGVLTVPTNKNEANTLLERLTIYLERKKKNHEPALVHTLDRELSGLMVVAKTPDAAKNLRAQFAQLKTKLVMVAIVNGVMEKDEGVIESYFDTMKNLNTFSKQKAKSDKEQLAVTKFKVLKRMEDATSVEVVINAPQRHQARVHLKDTGHTVLGDQRYGDPKKPHERWTRKRLAMHIVSLTFNAPETDKSLTFTSELPAPMKRFLRG